MYVFSDAADNSLPPPPDQIPEVQEDVEANTDDSNKYEETVSDVAFPGTPAVVADEKKDAGTAVVEGGSFCKLLQFWMAYCMNLINIKTIITRNLNQRSCVVATGRQLNVFPARKIFQGIFKNIKLFLQRNSEEMGAKKINGINKPLPARLHFFKLTSKFHPMDCKENIFALINTLLLP